MVIVLPEEIVAGPDTTLKLTGNPDEAVAEMVNGETPNVMPVNAGKLIV